MQIFRSTFLRLFFVFVFIILSPGLVNVSAGAKQKPAAKRTKVTAEGLRAFWNLKPKGDQPTPDKAVGDIAHMLSMDSELLAKAEPGACFNGLGNADTSAPCTAPAIPKVDQAYIWGMTKVGDDIWFGTMSNTFCAVFGTLLYQMTNEDPPPDLPGLPPTSSCVCEFNDAAAPWWMITGWPDNYPDQLKDVRTSEMYSYNTATRALTPRTIPAVTIDPSTWGYIADWMALRSTLGIRAAGSLGDVVLFAGPAIDNQSIYMFAFQASTGNFINSAQFTSYNNIRKFLVVDGVLYAGVGMTGGSAGRLLRWTGDVSDPFSFDEVGNIDASVAELAEHEGRIFVTTWPEYSGPTNLAGLWMSPAIPAGGLTTAEAAGWTKVWQVDDYEPDPVTARVYGGGALASFDGYLFWGTMHVPFSALLAHYSAYGDDIWGNSPEQAIASVLGGHRPISIFRGSGFTSGSPEVRVAYGMPALPVYTPSGIVGEPGTWSLVPNNLPNPMPLFGLSGFGNFFNNYTWSMSVFDNRLWVGTMDWSYMVNDWLPVLFSNPDFQIPLNELPQRPSLFGADLFFFPDATAPAIPETLGGVGNYTNYGIRNMIADDKLYLGMANPMNLLTDTTDNIPEGGWELLGLTARSPNTPSGTGVTVTTSDGIQVTFCNVAIPGHTDSMAAPIVPSLLATLPWVSLLPPTGYTVPDPIYWVATSAFWRLGCSTTNLAHICVPSTTVGLHMFQLQYQAPGQTIWVDITSATSSPGMICGDVTHEFMGIIGLAGATVPPTITAVNPPLFPEGQLVTITGSGYMAGTTAVTFNGINATSFIVVDDTTITAIVPAGIVYGPVTVAVTTTGGTASLVVNYAAPLPPIVSSVSPQSFNEGQAITIIGSNFTGATGVTFNGIAPASFTVVDDTHITTTVPAGIGLGMVTVQVTTPAGSGSGVFAWANGATAIPTLSEWGLILLTTALLWTALWRLRRNQLPPPA